MDAPPGDDADNQPGDDKKDPAAVILKWIAVIGGACETVTDILEWFR